MILHSPVSQSTLLLATCFMGISCLAYSLALDAEAVCSSEMSVDFQRTTWCYIPGDYNSQYSSNNTIVQKCTFHLLYTIYMQNNMAITTINITNNPCTKISNMTNTNNELHISQLHNSQKRHFNDNDDNKDIDDDDDD
jgi:hypothetical protein